MRSLRIFLGLRYFSFEDLATLNVDVLSRGAAGFLWGKLFGTSEGIILKGAFPLCNAGTRDEEVNDAMKISGGQSTNIRRSAVEILLRLVSTPLNKGSS